MTEAPVSRAIRNSLIIFAGQFAGRLIDLWAVVLIARHFGETEYGRFSFVLAYVGYFAVIAEMGFQMIFVRELVRQPERAPDLLSAMLIIRLALFGLSGGLAATLILLPGYPAETVHLVWIMVFAMVVSSRMPSIRTVYEQIFQAGLRMKIPILLRLLDSLIIIALLYAAIGAAPALKTIIIIYVVSFIPGMILMMRLSRGLIRPAARIDFASIRYLFRQALPLTLLGIFAMLAGRIDVLLLSLWRSEAEIGLYSAAYRLTEALRIFPTAALMSLFPLVSGVSREHPEPAGSLLQTGLKLPLIIVIPACIMTTFIANAVIELFYTAAYIPAGRSLSVLVWAEAPAVFTLLLSQTLIALDRRYEVVGMSFLQLAVNVALNLFLIPQSGYIGAAVATVFTELAGWIGYSFIIYRVTGWSTLSVVRPLLPATGAAILCGYLLQGYAPGVIATGCAAVYGLVLWRSGGLTPADVALFRQAVAGR